MARFGKFLSLCLVVILAFSILLMVKPVDAQSIAKPSVPEFTLIYTSNPYDVLPIYGIDPYTGDNITIEEGHHVYNASIEVSIVNQGRSDLFYNIRYKGHFGGIWTELYSYDNSSYSSGSLLRESTTEITFLSIPAVYPFIDGNGVDFQVQSLLWKYVEVFISDHPGTPIQGGHYENRLVLVGTSDWSNTQTITIPAGSSSVTPAPSSTNSQSNMTPTWSPDTVSGDSTLILFSVVVIISSDFCYLFVAVC